MLLRAGSVLRSPVSPAEVVVVRAGDPSVVVELGGVPMTRETPSIAVAAPVVLTGQLGLGRRYVLESAGLELLCVEPGPGQLTVAGRPLGLKASTRR